jgi:hypothetical protein
VHVGNVAAVYLDNLGVLAELVADPAFSFRR